MELTWLVLFDCRLMCSNAGFAANLDWLARTPSGACSVTQANVLGGGRGFLWARCCVYSGRIPGNRPGGISPKAALGERDRPRAAGSRYGSHTQKQGLCRSGNLDSWAADLWEPHSRREACTFCSRPPLCWSKAMEARNPNSRSHRAALPPKALGEGLFCLWWWPVILGL